MKQAHNNEIDLLLRSLPRGSEETARQTESDHLDADELNSYAEGVAPAPARARYTEHLADCEACRGLVVGLTQAAGAANRYNVPEEQGGLSFWQKLAALFSPAVLRYAVPALVLTFVIGIGLLALQKQRRTQFVARNEPAATALPSAQRDNAAELNPAPQPQGTIQNGAQSATSGRSPKERTTLLDDKTQTRQEEIRPEPGVTQLMPRKDVAQPAAGASIAESQPYDLEPKAAAPPPPAPLLDAEKSTEFAKERPAKREDQARDQDEALQVQSDDVHGPNRSRNIAAASRRNAGVMGGRGPSGMEKNKKAGEVETRTVMGRHFTRDGDAWIDTAYESSRATIRVVRGSDQYRALVADEPGLRKIAEQFSGVVVVVWKNRAYRIQ
ncbi:MAG: zf-HC2 domain-containing protein [Pyrinomonadaceae bacterium]